MRTSSPFSLPVSQLTYARTRNIKKRATKRPQKPNPPRSPSPDLSDGDQALPYAPHAASDDDESDQDKSGKGLRIRSERLKGNKGRLNAVDVVYGGIRQLLQLKMWVHFPPRVPSLTHHAAPA